MSSFSESARSAVRRRVFDRSKSVYEASLNYKEAGRPLVVFGGVDCGMGSSRNWAAKGTFLHGVRTVITRSYGRVHRSNLMMMGVVPLEFRSGQDADSLGIDGTECFDVAVVDTISPGRDVEITATKAAARL